MQKRSLEKSIRKIQEDEGIVEAYLTAWDTVDSYRTSFQKGSFSKTFENRVNKIRLLWNHETLAGKCLEAYEDDYGAFVRVQFNLETDAGRTAFSHIKAGDVDAFSFGFNVINEKWVDGIRTFTEVKCLECSPVLFPANEAAVITEVRKDNRADDFNETFSNSELNSRGWRLFNALEQTLDDIVWSNNNIDLIISKSDNAISEFHGQYLTWLSESSDIRAGNDLKKAVYEKLDFKTVVEKTALTINDLNMLRAGKLLNYKHRDKLAELPEEIQKAHKQQRGKVVEALCNELREAGFTTAEKVRFTALLGIKEKPQEIDETINFIKQFRQTLISNEVN